MPYGRGGAGNFYQAEEDKKRAAADLEAAATNSTTAPSSRGPDDIAPSSNETPSQTQSQEYAHMGRGGAGNWYSPKDLNRTGQFVSSSAGENGQATTHTPIYKDAERNGGQQQLPTARLGRGGAGNMLWGAEETIDDRRRREREDEGKKEALREKVMHDVEAGLAKPGKAIIGEDLGVGKARR